MRISRSIWQLIKSPVLLLVVLLLIAFSIKKIVAGDFMKNLFSHKPLLIDNTPLVITQVRNIAELQTAQLYAEIIADSVVYTQITVANEALRNIGMSPLPAVGSRKLVLIVKGKVVAGLDLQLLKAEDIYVKDDSVSVKLPVARYLEVITNPADIETFIEEGNWTDNEVTAVKNKARRLLLQKAAQQQLLRRASEQSTGAITNLLQAYGFSHIHLEQPETR
jgi:hypothetical protein